MKASCLVCLSVLLISPIQIVAQSPAGEAPSPLIQVLRKNRQPDRTLSGSLQAYYPFNGNANDQSGNSYNGILISAALTSDRFGNPGKAYHFDGSTSYIRLGNILTDVFVISPAQFTITGWANTDAYPSYPGGGDIIAKTAGGTFGPYQWSLNHDIDGKLKWQVDSKMDGSEYVEKQSISIPTGRWFFYALVFDGTQATDVNRVQLYVDGLTGTFSRKLGTFGTATEFSNQEITIGAGHAAGNPFSPNNQYTGSIDDIRIYDYVLSATQIDSLFHEGGWPLNPPARGEYTSDINTLLLLHMNEISGTDASDASSYHTGAIATGIGIASARFGNGRTFNGSTDYLEGSSGNLNFAGANYTLEAWIKTFATAGQAIITTHNPGASTYSNTGLYIPGGAGGGFFDMDINNGAGTSTSNFNGRKVNDGRWHHVAGVRNGSTISLYIDGRLDFQKSVTQEPLSSTIYRIGQSNGGSYFNGIIDEVRISGKARQPGEFDLQLPPTNLTAAAVSNSVNLSWQNGGGGASFMRYRIYRGTDSTTVSLIDSSTSASYTNSGLAGGLMYFFRVSAVDSTGFEAAMSYAASATVTAILGEYPSDASTVLLLHLDESAAGNALDASSYNTGGTSLGTNVVGGRYSNARTFNGTTDYIEGPSSHINFATSNFTLEAWIRTTSNAGQEIFTVHSPITGKYNNTAIFVAGGAGGGYLDMDLNNGQGTLVSNVNGRKVNDGQWHHVAGVRNGGSLYVYVDGKLDFQKLLTQEPYNSTIYRVGQSNSSSFFNGLIDEVRISNKARQPSEFSLQLPPVNLTATTIANSINLGWQNGGGAIPLLRYKIYRGSDSTNVVLLDSTTSTLHTDVGLTGGKKYYYRVSATDATGFEGAKGFAASATALPMAGEYASDSTTVLLLHMDELSGTDVADASTFNTGGTASGTTIVSGRFGKARSYNGTTDYVEGLSNNLISTGQNFTLEAWIKTVSNSGGAVWTSHNPGTGKFSNTGLYVAGETGGGYFDVDINNGQGTSASNFNGRKINDGQWHHIAGVRFGTTLSLYVDGKLDFQKTLLQEPNASTLYRIAQNYPGGFFQGVIDEIRISKKARLPNEFDLQLPPINLTATPTTNTINLTWSNGGGAVALLRYKIYRGSDSTSVALIDSASSGTYANTGLTNGKTYFYRISAIDATGFEGAKSYAVSATTPTLAGEYLPDIATLLLLHLDESGGPILLDASRYSIDGTATGTNIVPGRFGNARSFNGSTDYIEGYPGNMNFASQDYTIEAWIRTSSSLAQAIFTTHNPSTGSLSNTGLYIMAGTGVLDMDINNGQGISASTSDGRKVNDGLWHHVAGVRKSSLVSLYVDGRFDSQKSVTQEPNPSNLYRIGQSYPGIPFNGVIEELRVSSVARQPGEFKLQLPPVNVSASIAGNIVNLTWQNGGGGIGVLRYKVYRGTDSTSVVLIDSTAATTYSNSGLTPGRTYFYRISAVDALAFEGAKSYATNAVIAALAGEYSADVNTVLLLHMNETTGAVVSDATSYNSHGTATGTSVAVGRFGNARSFNGTTDFIEGSSSNLNFTGQSFTVEAWIKTSSTSNQAILTTHNTSLGTYDNIGLFVVGGAGNNFLDMDINGSQGAPSTNYNGRKINDGQWHHVAAVHSAGTIALYVDGRFDFLKLVIQEPAISTLYRVGQSYPGSFFNGVIDELRISNKARQPGEFNLQLPPSDLVATAVGTSIGLRWSNGGGGIGLLRYRIYRGSDSTNVVLLDSTTSASYLNLGLPVGNTYFYRVSAVDATGFEGTKSYAASGTTLFSAVDRTTVPTEFYLYQNYPNPFNPSTRIPYAVPRTAKVEMRILDVLGRPVAVLVDGEKSPGIYEVHWDATDLPSGIYLCHFRAGEYLETRKMILLK